MTVKRNFGHLGRRQRAVINDLLNGLNKYESLERNKVRPSRYREWLRSKLFREELAGRFNASKRQSKFLMALSLPQAAEKLAGLIKCEKEEISRKACVDIISLQQADVEAENEEKRQGEKGGVKIFDAEAAKMLATLAEKEGPNLSSQVRIKQ